MSEAVHRHRFAAMGTTAHIVVVGGTFDHLEQARRRIGQLERRWSRFLPDSEISAMNAADGLPLIVSDDTGTRQTYGPAGWLELRRPEPDYV